MSSVEHAIISTDLALYFQKRGSFFDIVKSHSFDIADTKHHGLLCSMLMTASDLGAITRPWHVEYQVTNHPKWSSWTVSFRPLTPLNKIFDLINRREQINKDFEQRNSSEELSLFWNCGACLTSISWIIENILVLLFRPSWGGGTIYSNGFFLFSQFWSIDIFIVQSCEWYHLKAPPA